MKNYILSLFAIIIMAFASCTNSEEVEIVQKGSAALIYNTSDTYSSYLPEFQNYIGANKSLNVGLTTLIYREDGSLYKEISCETRTFQKMTQDISDIEYGTYTIITIETLVNSNNGNKSDVWEIMNKERLNTVRIDPKYLIIEMYNCLGLASQTVNITNKTNPITITPKPIGSFVDLEIENFDRSTYSYFGFYFKNVVDGYYLEPNRSDRYYYSDYTAEHTWEAIGRIKSKNDGTYSSHEKIQLFVLQSGRTNYCFGPSSSIDADGTIHFHAYPNDDSFFDFKNGEYYEAYCLYKGAPEYVITFFGLKSEFQSWYKLQDKSVNPIFVEPCISWGASVSDVKTFMSRNELISDIEPTGDGFYWMRYYGTYKEINVDYYFENISSGLVQSTIFIDEADASAEDIVSIFENTYKYINEGYYSDGNYYLLSNSQTKVAVYPDLKTDSGLYFTRITFYSRKYVESSPTRANSCFVISSSKPKGR